MYTDYADDIYRFIFVHVRDVELAEDLTSDTFLKAWKNFKTFDSKQPRGWLYAIARNNMADHWRKKKPLPLDETIEIVDEAPSHAEVLDKKMSAKRTARALATLPPDMKSVVTLRFMQGYSVKQTAEALDMNEGNVRIIQFRALKKLRGALS